MEAQTLPRAPPAQSNVDSQPRAIRVNPDQPLRSSHAPQNLDSSPNLGNTQKDGMSRTTSRKRRVSGGGNATVDGALKPAAPEVPRAPPVSYREPYANGGPDNLPYGDPTSFAARARGPPDDPILLPESPLKDNFESIAQTTRHNRRGSIRRSSAARNPDPHELAGQKDAHKDAHKNEPHLPSPKADVISSQQQRDVDLSPQQVIKSPESRRQHRDEAPSPSQSNTRRTSASGNDPRKEWAVDRSPLQKLEGKLNDISKEEKRARVEEAERLLRKRKDNTDLRHKRMSRDEPNPDPIPVRHMSENAERTRSRRATGQNQTTYPPQELNNDPGYPSEPLEKSPHQENTRQKKVKPELSSNPNDIQRTDQNSNRGINPVDASPRKGDVRFAQQEQSSGSGRPTKQVSKQQYGLYQNKAEPSEGTHSAATYDGHRDPIPPTAVQSHNQGLNYVIPPETASGIAARQIIGFGGEPTPIEKAPAHHKHRISNILHRGHKAEVSSPDGANTQPRYLNEWRQAGTAQLTAADFIADQGSTKANSAWWEKRKSNSQQSRGATDRRTDPAVQPDEINLSNNFSHTTFQPTLYTKCGPLLRFTGIRQGGSSEPRDRGSLSSTRRETWHGSVMIVTLDSQSVYDPPPTLQLLPEPIELLPPPPQQVDAESGHSLPPAYVDPVAGLPKLTRTGSVVYVKPVEDLEPVDLSRLENDDGLFEKDRTATVPTGYGIPSTNQGALKPESRKGSISTRLNRRSGRGQVKGARLHAERGVTFWRFNLEVELADTQQRIGYRINNSATVGFWVPPKGQTMNMMFHSCNGFSMSVNPDDFSGPDPLWRDVLNNHQTRPFHVMIGGGDQIYNDRVMSETTLFQEWLNVKNPLHKHTAPFTIEMRDELEAFYLERYSMWFSQGLFGMANSQIPMINVWDDHDIIDGFGSYPHHFMSSPVFCGLGAVAFKYYMLFQHQSVVDEGPEDEPSWLMGAAPGPYINHLSRSLFMFLGKNIAFLGLDCRTERMREEILSESSYNLAFDRCRKEIVKGETKHLIVLLGVPIAYPRLNFLENLLTSRVMDPLKALGRAGMLGGFINKFDGGVEILDDLDDHWTAKHHKQERKWFIEELQELAAEKSIRVTILGGDVHLAAIGQFFSSPKLHITKDRDHRYMPNIISSAIVNTPPPELMADILNKRDKKHFLDKKDKDTSEDMIPMFTHDTDGKNRNNKRLLPRSTPPATPPILEPDGSRDSSPQPQNRLQRTLSLGRGDVKPSNLIRRLSGRGRAPSPDTFSSNEYATSLTASSPRMSEEYIPPKPSRMDPLSDTRSNGGLRHSSAPLIRPGNFHRRPTNISEKAVLKGGANDAPDSALAGHINLEHGLDICINCEVSPKDPAGITVPYRLLVPALWHEGFEDMNTMTYRKQ
ncbi:MAG: hypothetical protein Q9167_007789, partial [Letrouitia subvulpina]